MTEKKSLLLAMPAGAWLCLGLGFVVGAFVWLASAAGGAVPRVDRSRSSAVGDGQSRPSRIVTTMSDPATTDVIDFGQITPGGSARTSFRLENQSNSAVEVAKIRTSCDCLSVDLSDRLVRPRQAVTAQATIDLSDEPEFSGGLRPEAEFLDATGQPFFVRSFRATVGRSPTAAGTIDGDAAKRRYGVSRR